MRREEFVENEFDYTSWEIYNLMQDYEVNDGVCDGGHAYELIEERARNMLINEGWEATLRFLGSIPQNEEFYYFNDIYNEVSSLDRDDLCDLFIEGMDSMCLWDEEDDEESEEAPEIEAESEETENRKECNEGISLFDLFEIGI